MNFRSALRLTLLVTPLLIIPPAHALTIQFNGTTMVVSLVVNGAIYDPINEFYIKSELLAVDTLFATPTVTNALGTGDIGTWNFQYVTQDHYGNPLLQDTIRFFVVTGDGVSNGEAADFSFKLGSVPSGQPDCTSNPDCNGWLSDYHDSVPLPGGTWYDNVPIIPVSASVPEPQPWGALMLSALGLGYVARRRRADKAA